jgi:hypothetical protein
VAGPDVIRQTAIDWVASLTIASLVGHIRQAGGDIDRAPVPVAALDSRRLMIPVHDG